MGRQDYRFGTLRQLIDDLLALEAEFGPDTRVDIISLDGQGFRISELFTSSNFRDRDDRRMIKVELYQTDETYRMSRAEFERRHPYPRQTRS